tara:strand:+ start:52105 stop:53193 length:1089 start_codon:yes stop_codon:yes gene_type:complete
MRFFNLIFLFFLSYLNCTAIYAKQGPQQKIESVILTAVYEEDFGNSIEALGSTMANETVVITSDLTEKISKIYFVGGQNVQKGYLLVSLNDKVEQAELKAAKAELEKAKLSYQRAQNLQKSKAVSQATLQERLAVFQKSKALVEEVNARLNQLNIVAPFDGTLGFREVSVGALIQPGQNITTIDNIDEIKVDFEIPSIYLSRVTKGMKIYGLVDAFEGKEFEGKILLVNTRADPITRTIKIRGIIPNKQHLLRPGLLMNIILKDKPSKVLLVPEEALVKKGKKDFIFLVNKENNEYIVKKVEVKIGSRKKGIVEIISGLSKKDLIVLHGVHKVQSGDRVNVLAITKPNESIKNILQKQMEIN